MHIKNNLDNPHLMGGYIILMNSHYIVYFTCKEIIWLNPLNLFLSGLN